MQSFPSTCITNHPNHLSGSFRLSSISHLHDQEVLAGRYLKSFSTLLTGIKVSPLCVSYTKDLSKPCVCTDMSFGNPFPENLIDIILISISLDSLQVFPHLTHAYLSL